jgi:hypothetical protein
VTVVTALTVLLALAGALMVLRSHRLEHTRRRLVEDVGLLQAALLPALPERIGAACVSAAYMPAEGVAAGGDFFDAFDLGDGRTCVLVGDVAGHGRESVPLAAHVHYTLRAYLEAGLTPREALHVGATALGPHLGERTVTAIVGVYDPVTGGLTYACAGHPPPVLTGCEHAPVTACSSPPLAAGLATGHRQTTVPLPPGTTACFFTDGVTDVRVGRERLEPAGLAELLRDDTEDLTAREILRRVVATSDDRADDMAACVLRPLPKPFRTTAKATEELELDAAKLERGVGKRFLDACGVHTHEANQAVARARALTALERGTAVLTVTDGHVTVARADAVELNVLPERQRRRRAAAAAA